MPGVQAGQKRVLDPLKQELQIVLSCQVGAGNQTLVLLQEQHAFLTAESSLQPYFFLLITFKFSS